MFEVKRTDAFDGWLKGLKDSKGRTKIQARIDRLAKGNAGDVAPIGAHAMWTKLNPPAQRPGKKE
jgi:putative addiction module killer protein